MKNKMYYNEAYKLKKSYILLLPRNTYRKHFFRLRTLYSINTLDLSTVCMELKPKNTCQ